MGTREELLRRRICPGVGCGAVFWICCHCDRGHRYCGERCRQKKRRQQGRDANRRHQQSQEGRLDHRDRQRDYRERCRRRRVTDQPSPAVSDSDSIVVAEPSLSENGSESVSGEDRYATSAEFEPACIICGRRTLRSAPVQELQCPVPAVEIGWFNLHSYADLGHRRWRRGGGPGKHDGASRTAPDLTMRYHFNG